MKKLHHILASLTDTTRTDGYLNAGYAAIDADGLSTSFAMGKITPGGPPFTDVTTRLRMASIAKAATARAACALAVRGDIPLDADVRDIIGWHGAQAVTVRQLLSHTSGLTDRAGYLVDAGQSLQAFMADRPQAESGRVPGTYFAYANLNYILLGHVMERVTGRRFDQILRDEVLTPAGIAGGFNWAGVPVADRANHMAMYQRDDDGLNVQADSDDAEWQADLIWRAGRGHSFDDYRLGQDTSLLSPHAGLRMNILEAARLARFLGDGSAAAQLQRQVAWRYDPALLNGEDCDGLFTAFGLGLTIYKNHARIPGHLIGHAGHALGFTGGVWHNVETGVSHAYFLTGGRDETEGLDTETFYGVAELSIMQQL
jgi:CubicO group peptidase (beta-lactamase class C family)